MDLLEKCSKYMVIWSNAGHVTYLVILEGELAG